MNNYMSKVKSCRPIEGTLSLMEAPLVFDMSLHGFLAAATMALLNLNITADSQPHAAHR
jgi:hypothetical protein